MKHNNIYNKVKAWALVAAMTTAGTGMMTSCGDFLEIEPQDLITLEHFWNEKKDVENIIAGCYSRMADYGPISRMMIWGEFRSENIVNNGIINEDVDLERLLKENITANNHYTYWGDFYEIINRCNTVIYYAPQVAAKDLSYTQSALKAHIAEVTALRSLCYFYLIRTFRNVPYNEQAYLDDNQEQTLPATDFNTVLNKLIASLEAVKNDALTKYPEATGLAGYYNTGRVTKDFIHALLCEMYLWKGDYQKCVEYADLIIEQKAKNAKDLHYSSSDFENSNGYPLIPSRYTGNYFGRAFSQIFATNNSMESIFEINYEKGSGEKQKSNGPVNDFFGGQARTPFVVATTYVSQDQRDGLYKVSAAENAGYDARPYENIRFSSSSPVYINKYSTMGMLELTGGKDAYKNAMYSAQYETYGDKHVSGNKSNYIIYRLSDIMLLKAEALTQMISADGSIAQGTPDYELYTQAFDLVDAVNKRSLMETTPTHVLDISKYETKTAITNLVYQERQRELMFEGKRYFDLVRRSLRDGNTQYLSTNVANKSAAVSAIIQSKMSKIDAIFWPYNLDEMKVNHNLVQNPAFGSGENNSYK